MIVVEKQIINKTNRSIKCDLFADEKSDVTDEAVAALFPVGYTVEQGSSVMTAGADMAFMKSDGQWNWV